MEFLKNHYEKVLLSVVLLALAVVTALLPSKTQTSEPIPSEPPTQRPYALPDTSTNRLAIKRLETATLANWEGTHNLFNPVKWKRRADGRLEKIESRSQEGPQALEILKISPLYYMISFDGVVGTANNLRYQFGIVREAEKIPSQRRKTSVYSTVGDRNDHFTLREVRGAVESPDDCRLELTNGVSVTVSRAAPYRRVDGYTVDLRYPPEDRTYADRRKGDILVLGGETNNIVAIFEDKVVMSATSTRERTTITNVAKRAAF
jgi:hypothetical protein